MALENNIGIGENKWRNGVISGIWAGWQRG
jgi:hypothetical protein